MLNHTNTSEHQQVTVIKPPFNLTPFTIALGLALMSMTIGTIQQAHAAEAQTQVQIREYNIGAGSLAEVINLFASSSRLALTFDAATLKGLQSNGLHGKYSITQGFEKLLEGKGLQAQSSTDGSYTLKKVPITNAPQSEKTESLPEVAVTANSDNENETANSPIKGYVAKRVTSATKTDASILETPQAISVITRDELNMRNAQRDGDALRYTSGVISENYGADIRPGYDIGNIRGFDSSTTSMYRDGLRETNGLWARISTDLSTTERIEILKGPSSVLYGQSEPAGVINKVTKKPTDTPLHQLEIQAGNFDRYQGSFDLGGPVDDDGTVLYRVIGLMRESESQYEYDKGHSSKDDREVFAPSITIKPSDKTTLTLQAEYLHAETGVPFTVGTGNSASNIMLGDYTYDKNERKQLTYGYLFEHIFNDTFTFRQNLRASDVDYQYLRMGYAARIGNTITRSRSIIDEQLSGFALDNQAQIKFNTGSVKHTALFGLDFQRSSYTNRDGDAEPATLDDLLDLDNPVYGRHFSTPAFTSENIQATKQVGFYAQDQIKFDDHWVLTLSGRKDWSKTDTKNKISGTTYNQKDSEFTYRTGLAYVFDNGFAPYISHSTSFNPSVGIGATGSPLKPTTGKQKEIGLRYLPTESRNSYTFSIYELTQQNVVVYDPFSFATHQVGEIRSRGAELEIKTKLLENLNLITALTYNGVEITKTGGNISVGEKGDSPIYVPKQAISAWIDYKVPAGVLAGVGIGGGVRYIGHSNGGDPFAGTKYTNESYTLYDAAINYAYDKHWNLAFNVNNVFNKKYTNCGYSGCTLGYERTAIASLKYTF